MGKGIVDRLKSKCSDLEIDWLAFEIHPETPSAGVSLAERFPGADLQGMYKELNKRGHHFDIQFGKMKLLSNSHIALEAGEFARSCGKVMEESFHKQMFYAYFTETKDIGDLAVVLDVAQKVGLDVNGLKKALEEHKFASRLDEANRLAQKYDIESVPTFIFQDTYRIEGAQPMDVYLDMIRDIRSGKKA